MPIDWEHNLGGVQVEDFDTEEEDVDYEIQKPQTQNIEHEEQIKDLAVNIMLIFYLEVTNKSMSNNCKSEGFGMQRAEDDQLGILAEYLEVFTQSSGVFAQSLYLLVQLTKGVQGERNGVNTTNVGKLGMWIK